MSTPIWMMDPRAPTGLLLTPGTAWPDSYPGGDDDATRLQLINARLDTNGTVALVFLDAQDQPAGDTVLDGVTTLADGSVVLELGDGSGVVFKPADAARVNATILKLANAQF